MSENGGARSTWRFLQVLTGPGKAFAEIAAEPAFLKLALVITGVNLLLGIVIVPKIQAFIVWMVKHGPATVPPEKMEQVLAFASIGAAVGSIAGAVVVPWLIWLLVACVLKVYAMFSAKETSFKALFAVAVCGYLPMLVGGIIYAFLILSVPVENFQNVSLSLAALLPPQKGFLYFFLTKCSPFTWWSLILWGIGGATAMGVRPAGVTTYLFGLWLAQALAVAALTVWNMPGGVA